MVKTNKVKREPRFHVNSGAMFTFHWQTALWLMMGWFCLLLKEGEGRKEEEGGEVQRAGLRLRSWAQTHHYRCSHNYVLERDRETEVENPGGRSFLHILPHRRYSSQQISERNASVLTWGLWESLRQKLGLDRPWEQTNAAPARERVNMGQPRILKQTCRFIFPKPFKKFAAVPTNVHRSQRWWPSLDEVT